MLVRLMIDPASVTTFIVSPRDETDFGRRRDRARARPGGTFGRRCSLACDCRRVARRDRRRRHRPPFSKHRRIDSGHQQHGNSKACRESARQKNARVLNVDATVIAEAPKIAPHIAAMRQNIAAAIGVSESDVSVKATTNEKLGPIGRGEGIAAVAVATVEIVGSGD